MTHYTFTFRHYDLHVGMLRCVLQNAKQTFELFKTKNEKQNKIRLSFLFIKFPIERLLFHSSLPELFSSPWSQPSNTFNNYTFKHDRRFAFPSLRCIFKLLSSCSTIRLHLQHLRVSYTFSYETILNTRIRTTRSLSNYNPLTLVNFYFVCCFIFLNSKIGTLTPVFFCVLFLFFQKSRVGELLES